MFRFARNMDLSNGKSGRGDGSAPHGRAGRPVRADAQRSIDALLEAAKAVFVTAGVDAPVREIAKRAGVGIGTVYRNFPQRADLIAAVFRREIDACAEAADSIAQAHAPFDAVALWIQRYVDFLSTKRGLAAALHSGDPAYEALPGYFRQGLEPVLQGLLDRAAEAGEVRADVDAYELLRAIASLTAAADADGAPTAGRMVGLLVDGLRFGAGPREIRAP